MCHNAFAARAPFGAYSALLYRPLGKRNGEKGRDRSKER